MSRTYYQQYYFTDDELSLAENIIQFQTQRKEQLEKSDKTEEIEKKIQKIDIILNSVKYYYSV